METEVKVSSEWSDEEDLINEVALSSPNRTVTDTNRNDEATEDNGLNKEESVLEDERDFSDEEFYNPAEFGHLNLPADIKELFKYITRYQPQVIEIEAKLKPFIPEMIPAVGDIDAFIKVDRPDGAPELLGLNILDEPSLQQSDPSVLDLRLRSIYKQSSAKVLVAKEVEDVAKHGKAVDKWIKDIGDLHKSKPLPTVTYTRPMPDIDRLLQEWPPEVEESLRENGIPPADLDCDLIEYVDIVCGLMDIPTEDGSRLQSLHLLFTLYAEMVRISK